MKARTVFVAGAGFEAARQLEALASDHPAHRLHGHSFRANVCCDLPRGWGGFPGGEVAGLRTRLEATLAQLDYRLLNERIASPTDENLARWLQSQLDVPGLLQVGVHSTGRQGVALCTNGQLQVWRRYVFQSAHRLPQVPPGHKCGRMHGHGFEVIVQATQQPGDTPIDPDELDRCWVPMQAQLDYACLNDLPGLENPTSEVLASWIWARLKATLPALSRITVFETASCGAHFDGTRYRIWKDVTLDSAVQFSSAPEGNPLRRLHGHTYTLRLQLSAALDETMGWVVDFGDVKQLFDPIFQMLDHQALHEIPDVRDADTASLACWILENARVKLPQLAQINLFETRGCGAVATSAGVEADLS
jgi:6-pyruvoyltetrahydropterin/6-carboxytetrahydropterin synthase